MPPVKPRPPYRRAYSIPFQVSPATPVTGPDAAPRPPAVGRMMGVGPGEDLNEG